MKLSIADKALIRERVTFGIIRIKDGLSQDFGMQFPWLNLEIILTKDFVTVTNTRKCEKHLLEIDILNNTIEKSVSEIVKLAHKIK